MKRLVSIAMISLLACGGDQDRGGTSLAEARTPDRSGTFFRMDLSAAAFPDAGFDGHADTIRNRYSLTRHEGIGPSGQAAYRITLDSTQIDQFYVGWHEIFETGPPFDYGHTIFVRFRMRWIADANCENYGWEPYPTPVAGTLARNKFHIVNDAAVGGGSAGRAMIHIECEAAIGDSVAFQVARANRDQVCDTGYGYAADTTWRDFQYQHSWSSAEGVPDGTYKLWIDNDTRDTPTCEVTGLVLNAEGEPNVLKWGFYINNPPRPPNGNIGWEVTDYQVGTSFDDSWHN